MLEPSASLKLLQKIEKAFNLDELKMACFSIEHDFDNISCYNKRSKIRELLLFCDRSGRLLHLQRYFEQARPRIKWHASFEAFENRHNRFEDIPISENPLFLGQESAWSGIERYYMSLYQEVGFVRILGKREAEELNNVFTAVNLLDRVTAERRYTIEEMRQIELRDFEWHKKVDRMTGDEAVTQFKKLFIFGKPGAGKTTFLKHTALRAINHDLKKIPIFISLKELSDSQQSIMSYIEHLFDRHKLPKARKFVEQQLRAGNCLLLLDGLDEVNLSENRRSNMIQSLNNFIIKYNDNFFLMTCRVAATDYSFSRFEYVEMADFDTKQIANYIDQWFTKDEVKRKACRQQLFDRKENKAVRELAQVPLLLSLLCIVFEERGEFPSDRDEIYEEATRALLVKWDASRNINRETVYSQLNNKHKQKMLAHIAFNTFEKGEIFLKEKQVTQKIEEYLAGVPKLEEPDGLQVLNEMEANHGIFVERAHQIHSFSHLTLQEYYTALYITQNEKRGLVEGLMTHVGDDRWNEVFFLTASMLDDATDFFNLFLHQIWMLINGDPLLAELLNSVDISISNRETNYKIAALRAFSLFHLNASNLLLVKLLDPILYEAYYHFDSDNTLFFEDYQTILERAQRIAERLKIESLISDLKALDLPSGEFIDHQKMRSEDNLNFIIVHETLTKYGDDWRPSKVFNKSEMGAQIWQKLNEAQHKKFRNYLNSTYLLVNCLEVAYVPNRRFIEDQILMPL
ncbi:MAG: NACHT domain-containing protein [Chloroflexota bacterium]